MNGNDEFNKEVFYNNIKEDYNKTNFGEMNNLNIDPKKFDDYLYTEELEVMSDGSRRWISYEDMLKVCKQISISELEYFGINFNPETSSHISVQVNDEFVGYVRQKTKDPKFIPVLVRVRTSDFEKFGIYPPGNDDRSYGGDDQPSIQEYEELDYGGMSK